MSFRQDAIELTEDIVDALGEPARYQGNDGLVKTINVVFEREYFDPELGAGLSGSQSLMTVKKSDGPFIEGEILVLEDTEYRIVQMEPDEDGQVRLILEIDNG